MWSSRKGSILSQQTQHDTESSKDVAYNTSPRIQIISSYHKTMLNEYISSNSSLDPNFLTTIHQEYLNSFARTENLAGLTSKLNENFHDSRERWLLTSMKTINILVNSLKNKYQDEMEQHLEEVSAGAIYPAKTRNLHQTLLKSLKTRLEEEISNSIQNEPIDEHVEAFSTQITKLWKQYSKTHSCLESDAHEKQSQADNIQDSALLRNRIHSENANSSLPDTSAIQSNKVADGLARNFSPSDKCHAKESSTLITKPEVPYVSGGLSRRTTANLVRTKKKEKCLHGTVVEALSTEMPKRSYNTKNEAETSGSSLQNPDTRPVEKLRDNTSSAFTIKENKHNLIVRKKGPEANLQKNLSQENEKSKVVRASSTEKKIDSRSMTAKNDILPNNSIPPTAPDIDIETETPAYNATFPEDPSKFGPKHNANTPSVTPPPSNDENTVVFYLSPEWMRFRQKTSQENDQVWYERTIVSSFPDGEWKLGCHDTGKPWSLSELWGKPNRRSSIGGSLMINGNSQNITPEYLLSVIMNLVRMEHTTKGNKPPSKIIIGVPYWIDSRRRQQILNAADSAGFKNCRIFNDNSLSAFHMYINKKVPKVNELVVFSLNSNKLDVSVYRSNDFVTAVLLGNCGNYESAITILHTDQCSREVKEIRLQKAIEVAFEKADRYDKVAKPRKRSVLICTKDELNRSQLRWLLNITKQIPNFEKAHIENSASFYGMLDIAASKTFLENDAYNNIIKDGRPYSVKFETSEYCFETLNFDINRKHYPLYEEAARIEIPGRFRTVYITENIEPHIKCRLGRLEIKNATTKSEILVDVGYNKNGILMIKSVRGRSSNIDRPFLYGIAFEWVPEDSTYQDKKPWYKSLLSLTEYVY